MTTSNRKPSEIFKSALKAAYVSGRLVGADVLNVNFRITWVTILVIGSIITYFMLTIMTIIKLFAVDWKILLEATCMASSVVQGGAKLYCCVTRSKILSNQRVFLENFYAEYECKGPKYYDTLHVKCLKLLRIIQLISLLYFFPAIIALSAPFVLIFINGERYLIMQFHVPGLDVDTSGGHLGTLGVHTMYMFAGTIGLYAGDLFVVIFLWQSLVFKDIFKLKVDELNEELNAEGKSIEEANNSKNLVLLKLIDIVKWHQMYTNYTKICNEAFFEIISVVVSTAGISILLTLFILLFGSWPGAFPYLVVSFYNLYVYCIFGSRIEVSNDDFSFQIYNIHWYKMTTSCQKVVRLMLMQSQNPQTIQVAGIIPLSVSTALQITKTVYTFFTMMLQFMEE